jgi:hypothetical protein
VIIPGSSHHFVGSGGEAARTNEKNTPFFAAAGEKQRLRPLLRNRCMVISGAQAAGNNHTPTLSSPLYRIVEIVRFLAHFLPNAYARNA